MALGALCATPPFVDPNQNQPLLLPLLKTTSIFQNWKFKILLLLEQQGIHEVLLASFKYKIRKDPDLKKKDAQARLWIAQCVDHRLCNVIRTCTTARDMIMKLEAQFNKKSIFTKYDLRKKLLTMKFKPSDSLLKHFEQFDKLISDLEAVGCNLDEYEKVCHLLLTLPDEFKLITTSLDNILSLSETENIINFVKNHIYNSVTKSRTTQPTSNRKDNTGMLWNFVLHGAETHNEMIQHHQTNESTPQHTSINMDIEQSGAVSQDINLHLQSTCTAPGIPEPQPTELNSLPEHSEVKFSPDDNVVFYTVANTDMLSESPMSSRYNSQIQLDLLNGNGLDENGTNTAVISGVDNSFISSAIDPSLELSLAELRGDSLPEGAQPELRGHSSPEGAEPEPVLDDSLTRPDGASPKQEFAEDIENENEMEIETDLIQDNAAVYSLSPEAKPEPNLDPDSPSPHESLVTNDVKSMASLEMICCVVLNDVAKELWCVFCGHWCLNDAEMQRHRHMHAAATATVLSPPQTSTALQEQARSNEQLTSNLTDGLISDRELLANDTLISLIDIGISSLEQQTNDTENLNVNLEEPQTESVLLSSQTYANNTSVTSNSNQQSFTEIDLTLDQTVSHSVSDGPNVRNKINERLLGKKRPVAKEPPTESVLHSSQTNANNTSVSSNSNQQSFTEIDLTLDQTKIAHFNKESVTDDPNFRIEIIKMLIAKKRPVVTKDAKGITYITYPKPIPQTYSCDTCGKTFKQKSRLRKHAFTHTGLKPFSCEICGKSKSYTSRHALKDHFRSTHTEEERPYSCNICGKRFVYRQGMNTHMKTHSETKPYECEICNQRFVSKAYVVKHMDVHNKELRFKCDVCNKGIRTKRLLTTHKIMHSEEKNKYICHVCGKTFLRNCSLLIHKAIHEPHKFFCDDCGASFPKKAVLIKHLQRHRTDKPFKCKICKKRFVSKEYLDRHKVTHSERKYKCDVCGQRFFYQSTLNRHMKAPHSNLGVPRRDRPPRR